MALTFGSDGFHLVLADLAGIIFHGSATAKLQIDQRHSLLRQRPFGPANLQPQSSRFTREAFVLDREPKE